MKTNTKKTLLAALLGTLCATTAHAQSSVTVFGQVDATVASRQLSGGARSAVVSDGGMSTSFFGFKGTEDLGNGLKAHFEASGFFTADTGASGRFAGSSDGLFSRRATVALSGDFGQVDLGRLGSPYFFSVIMFNPFGDSAVYSPIFLHTYTGGQAPMLLAPINGPDSGVSNIVQYATPVLSGFAAKLMYAAGEMAGDSGKRRLIASINYHKGPLALTLATEHDSTALSGLLTVVPPATTNPETRQRSYLGGATYDLKSIKLYAQLAHTRQNFTLANTDRTYKTWQLGAAVPAGAGRFLASWAHSAITLPASAQMPAPAGAGIAVFSANPKRDTVTAGYDHNLSKRTDVYALLMNDRYTGLSTGNSVALGIRHRF